MLILQVEKPNIADIVSLGWFWEAIITDVAVISGVTCQNCRSGPYKGVGGW